ncbi:insulin-like peptide receptor, partial [Paramuricea clavata]
CDSSCDLNRDSNRGCEDGSQDKCCDKECLGGCTRADSPHHCNACQHFRIGNGSCVATCPPGLKEVEKFICKEECPDDVGLEVNGKCYKKCPVGYRENGKKCDKCDNCARVCIAPKSGIFEPPIQKIKTLSDSAKLKGCEILNGNLEIEMRNVP